MVPRMRLGMEISFRCGIFTRFKIFVEGYDDCQGRKMGLQHATFTRSELFVELRPYLMLHYGATDSRSRYMSGGRIPICSTCLCAYQGLLCWRWLPTLTAPGILGGLLAALDFTAGGILDSAKAPHQRRYRRAWHFWISAVLNIRRFLREWRPDYIALPPAPTISVAAIPLLERAVPPGQDGSFTDVTERPDWLCRRW